MFRHFINSHPRIFCPSEIKFHKDLLNQFTNDPFSFARLGATIGALKLEPEIWQDEFGRAFVRCYERSAREHGKARWADKNPENSINVHHWNRLLSGQMHFILVIRNPYDILASMEEIRMDRAIPTDPVERAKHIVHYIECGLKHCRGYPERSHIFRYEDLISSPQDALQELLAKIGEKFALPMLDALSMRKLSGIEDPKFSRFTQVEVGSVGRWKKDLPEEVREAVKPVLCELVNELKYDGP